MILMIFDNHKDKNIDENFIISVSETANDAERSPPVTEFNPNNFSGNAFFPTTSTSKGSIDKKAERYSEDVLWKSHKAQSTSKNKHEYLQLKDCKTYIQAKKIENW